MQRRQFLQSVGSGIIGLPLAAFASHANPALRSIAGTSIDRLAQLATDLANLKDADEFWGRVRQEFLFEPGLVHLNCGSLGATPRLVTDAVAAIATKIEGNPVANTFSWGDAEMDTVRDAAARFIGASTHELAITRNTTEAMTAIATGLDLQPGDEVLTTNHEHGGGMVCWQYLRKHRGINIRYVELPKQIASEADILNRISEAITPKTKVCSFSHVDTITGLRMPIEKISGFTRPREILFVCDGAQAPGMIPVDVHALGVDAYACSGHKWMLAPKGTGLLYIRAEAQERIQPAFLHSGYNGYTASSGTRGVDRILGQGLAIAFHEVIGVDRIDARCKQLTGRLRDKLSGINRLQQLTPNSPGLSAGMTTYALSEGTSADVRRIMSAEHNIQIKSTQGTYAYCEESGLRATNYNAIRLSTHIFSSEADIDQTADALKNVLANL